MAQNDPIYHAGDRVEVFDNPSLTAAGLGGRGAVVVREHPNEPGTLEIAFDDGDAAYIPASDLGRLRRASSSEAQPAEQPTETSAAPEAEEPEA